MLILCLLLLSSSVTEARHFVLWEDAGYRLPTECNPISYKLDLDFPEGIFNGKASDYTGNVTISLECDKNISSLTLHLDKDYIAVKYIKLDDDDIDSGNYTFDEKNHQITINTPKIISAGVNTELFIEFTGKVPDDEVGIYRKSYKLNNKTDIFVTTKFEPVYARRMFPCFDEPSFKANFSVSVTYPVRMKIYFNTELNKTEQRKPGYSTDTFKTTNSMPTYLLCLMLSDFDTLYPDDTFRIISRPYTKFLVKYAADQINHIMEKLEKFTGYDFRNMNTKLDSLVIPDYVIGGMEHWGLISFSENYIFYNETEYSILKELDVVKVMAHEFAHQWFGDLVTICWWSENYLKEGMAQYLEYFITNEIHPEWELDKSFILEMVQASKESDVPPYAKSLNVEVTSQKEVLSKLGGLTYDKGASIFNMVKHIMGENNFRNGLQQYINQNKFKTVTSAYLWDALQENVYHTISKLPTDLNNVMNNWVGLPGYPVVYVQRKGNDVVVSQKKFTKTGEDGTSRWYIPISYTFSTQEFKFRSTSPDGWVTPEKDLLIPLVNDWKWIILNTNSTGYYRIDYEEAIWDEIREALKKDNFDGIPEMNRAQIIDDLFTFAAYDKIPYSNVLRILEFLANDTSYYTWKPTFKYFKRLYRKTGNSTIRNFLSGKLLEMSTRFYESVPLTKLVVDDHMYIRKQLLSVEVACQLGNENCISNITSIFKSLMNNEKVSSDKSLESLVYCNGIRYSNDSREWDFVWSIYRNANTSQAKEIVLNALGCAKNKDMLARYLGKTLEDQAVTSDDFEQLISNSYVNNPDNVDVTLNFLLAKYDEIINRFGGKQTWRYLVYELANSLGTEEQIKLLENFKNNETLTDVDTDIINDSINLAKKNIDWTMKHRTDMEAYFGLTSGSISIYFNNILIITCIFTFMFF